MVRDDVNEAATLPVSPSNIGLIGFYNRGPLDAIDNDLVLVSPLVTPIPAGAASSSAATRGPTPGRHGGRRDGPDHQRRRAAQFAAGHGASSGLDVECSGRQQRDAADEFGFSGGFFNFKVTFNGGGDAGDTAECGWRHVYVLVTDT